MLDQVISELKRIGVYDKGDGGVIAGIKGDSILIRDEASAIVGNVKDVLQTLKTITDDSGHVGIISTIDRFFEVWDALGAVMEDAESTDGFVLEQDLAK
ncbi:hypothetical protein [Cohnella soli]|uniref:Uncharacterized protein n=1 Tax=Cohnella soli TaxID=425005 RepID=A0ABW0HTK3_9BACL